jgi:hypothetical protein
MRSAAIASGLLLLLANSYSAKAEVNQIQFELRPVRQFLPCIAVSPWVTPTAKVVVNRGKFNDEMTIFTRGFKRGLKFDAFTVQNTLLLTNGQIDPNFKNFGLAWYQTDLDGNIPVTVRTILLDQIFGFAPQVDLKPTKTFHVGFWFNDPKDAQACGFDITKPTPFNGEQKAGPLAFISVPNPITKLGPLCTKPRRENSTTFVCDP